MTKFVAHTLAASLMLGIFGSQMTLATETIRLELSAGDRDCENVVVEMALPPDLVAHDHFTLERSDTSQLIPVQVDRNRDAATLVWIVRDKLNAGAVRHYRLTPAAEPSKPDRVTVTDDGRHLVVKVGMKHVFSYNHVTVPSPDPKHPYYARSGYIHPLYNPDGKVVTDDFNPDHAHQHGIMLAWRKMTYDGRQTNGWDQQAGLGKVEHATLEAFTSGPVFGSFKTSLRHVDLTAPGEPTTVLNETWYVKTYAFDDAFLFDITSTQTCASEMPVSIDMIHYGGMTIRGHAEWHEHRSFDYLTDEGKTKKDGNQSRPRWVDLSGPIAGRTSGALIMDHKSNFRFPQPVRLHPTMPYFCFTPASIGAFTIYPDKPYVSQYRFYIHNDPLDASVADQLWQQYVATPKVRIVP